MGLVHFTMNLTPMILILTLEPDMDNMYLYAEHQAPSFSDSEVTARITDTQTRLSVVPRREGGEAGSQS